MSEHQADRFVLTLSCQDRMGIVADVSRFLFEHRCNIVDSAQFGDPDNGLFFMRTSFQAQEPLTPSLLEANFLPIREKFGMNAAFHVQGAPVGHSPWRVIAGGDRPGGSLPARAHAADPAV